MSTGIGSFIRRSLVLLSGDMAGAVIALVQGIIIARILQPAGYGQWALVLVVVQVTAGLLTARTRTPLTVHWTQANEDAAEGRLDRKRLLVEASFLVDTLVTLLTVAVICVLAPFAVRFYELPESVTVAYYIVGASLLFNITSSVWWVVGRDGGHMRQLAVVVPAASLLMLAGTATLAWAGRLDLMTLAGLYFGRELFTNILRVMQVRRWLRVDHDIRLGDLRIGRVFARRAELGEFYRFMRSSFRSTMVSIIGKEGDVLVIGAFVGEAEVGVYRLGRSLVRTAQSMMQSATSLIFHDFSGMVARNDWENLRHIIRKILSWWLPAVVAAGAAGYFLAGIIIPLIYGAAFAGAVDFFRILLFGTCMVVMGFWAQPVVLAMRRYRYNEVALTLTSSVAFASYVVAAKYYGGIGIAWAVVGMWTTMILLLAVPALVSVNRAARAARLAEAPQPRVEPPASASATEADAAASAGKASVR